MASDFRRAKLMADRGVSAKTIFRATGFRQDGNGKWEFDLPTNDAFKMSGEKINSVANRLELQENANIPEEYLLSEVVNLGELTTLHPELKDLPVRFYYYTRYLELPASYVPAINDKGEPQPEQIAINLASYASKNGKTRRGSIGIGQQGIGQLIYDTQHEIQHWIETYEELSRDGINDATARNQLQAGANGLTSSRIRIKSFSTDRTENDFSVWS